MAKIPFRRKKEPPTKDSGVDIHIPGATVSEPSSDGKKSKKDNQEQPDQSKIKPFVITRDNVPPGLFREVRPSSGVTVDDSRRWDKERIREMLVEADPEKLPMLTVTRKGEFNTLVRATTFDQAARMGQTRNLRRDSFVSMYIRNRDVRAPSAFPEEGDSRKELMKQLEFMIAEEQIKRDTIRYGGA